MTEVLGDKPYLLGDRPRTLDCSVWAIVTHAAHSPSADPIRDRVRANPALVAYVDRFANAIGIKLPAIDPASNANP